MTYMSIGITTARINGLTNLPYLKKPNQYFVDFSLQDTYAMGLNTSIEVALGSDFGNACMYREAFKRCFDNANIFEDSTIAIIYNVQTGDVIAFASVGSNIWVDLRESFPSSKTFSELNIIPNFLEVY